ncbi:MAG: AAA family ATPase [bacterium]|jgi:predicted kinase
MQAIILMGIQASGKTTFYVQRFLHSHVRISQDLLRTRHREKLFLQACLDTLQPFVVDKTNALAEERRKYIELAKAAHFEVVGYYFIPDVSGALRRNATRPPKQVVPDIAIFGTRKKFEIPTYAEGFDRIYHVELQKEDFAVHEMPHENPANANFRV